MLLLHITEQEYYEQMSPAIVGRITFLQKQKAKAQELRDKQQQQINSMKG